LFQKIKNYLKFIIKLPLKNVTFKQKANTNISICLIVARWRHQQKTYRWGKNEHVLSDKNNNAKTKHKKKGKKPHFMYLKIVNINIITKTKNVFKSIKLLAGYRYSFCTH
jgi:hypothetical protein